MKHNQKIRITEGQIKRMVAESVKRVLGKSYPDHYKPKYVNPLNEQNKPGQYTPNPAKSTVTKPNGTKWVIRFAFKELVVPARSSDEIPPPVKPLGPVHGNNGPANSMKLKAPSGWPTDEIEVHKINKQKGGLLIGHMEYIPNVSCKAAVCGHVLFNEPTGVVKTSEDINKEINVFWNKTLNIIRQQHPTAIMTDVYKKREFI